MDSTDNTLESLETSKMTPSEQEQEDLLVEAIYNRIVASTVMDVTAKLHQRVHTGGMSYSHLVFSSDRQTLYPDLYRNESEVQHAMKKYKVEVPTSHSIERPSKEVLTHLEDARDSNTSINGTSNNQMISAYDPLSNDVFNDNRNYVPPTLSSSSTHLDIWGRIPPKEPKDPIVCSVCLRPVNTLRFAPHLDKCLGIGTMARAATGSNNLFYSNTLSAPMTAHSIHPNVPRMGPPISISPFTSNQHN
jgi:hypothetical protein